MSPPKGWKKPRVTLICEYCNGHFELTPAKAKGRRFCSLKCSTEWNKKHLTGVRLKLRALRDCGFCHKEFEVPLNNPIQRFCSYSCFFKNWHLEQGHQLRNYDRPCAICQKPMSPNNKKYCSKECMAKGYRKSAPPRQCEFCKEEFNVDRPSSKQRFCNHTCFAKWNALQQGQTLRSHTRKCPVCGEIVRAQNKQFCSSKCYGKTLQDQTPYNRILLSDLTNELQRVTSLLGHNPSRGEFEELGKFSVVPYTNSYGTWVKAKEAILGIGAIRLAGEDHPNWRGGWLPYYGPSWHPQKRKARKRDKVCQRCGKTPDENEQALDVHHKIPFIEFGVKRHKEANALTNLISLCLECHPKAEKEYRQNCK